MRTTSAPHPSSLGEDLGLSPSSLEGESPRAGEQPVLTPSLRERKKRETRHALQVAALEIASSQGVDHVSVEAIAARANVSVRTFFNYFPSRDDALAGVDPDRPGEVAALIATRPAGESPLEAVRAVMLARAPAIAAHKESWSTRMRVLDSSPELFARHAAAFTQMERAIAGALAEREGLPAGALYPTLVAGAASLVMRTALRTWSHDPSPRPLEDVVSEAFDILAGGLTRAPAPPPRSRVRLPRSRRV